MNQPRIAVEGEHDWLVFGEERIEVWVRQAMRVLAPWLQFHQVYNVDDADLQCRKMLAAEIYRSQRFQRWHISATGHHNVWLCSLVIARPFPDSDASRAMFDRLVHRQPLRGRLFACYHDVDIVAAGRGGGACTAGGRMR